MSRKAREKSQTGLYHILFRGINRQNIFEEEQDYQKLMDLIKEIKNQNEFKLYAFCLMDNHAHMLIEEKNPGDISKIMQKLLTRYAVWYNKKYLRSGSLIGNRYKSLPVERDKYLLTLVRYIHQNPKRAGIVKELQEYKWSSFHDYLREDQNDRDILDTAYILEMLSEDKEIAKEVFVEFHRTEETEEFEISDRRRKSEERIRRRIMNLLEGKEPHFIGTMVRGERDRMLKELKEREGFSIREIERATGISRGVISRIK